MRRSSKPQSGRRCRRRRRRQHARFHCYEDLYAKRRRSVSNAKLPSAAATSADAFAQPFAHANVHASDRRADHCRRRRRRHRENTVQCTARARAACLRTLLLDFGEAFRQCTQARTRPRLLTLTQHRHSIYDASTQTHRQCAHTHRYYIQWCVCVCAFM